MIYRYGDLPVPWTVAWSSEEEFYVDQCPWFKVPVICQKSAQGQGVPKFGQPHAMRQRQVMYQGLCDLCAKPLMNRTKVSLSGTVKLSIFEFVVQGEPLLHRECALESFKHCPSLKRQAANGRLNIRQIFQYRAKLTPAGPDDRAKVPLCKLPLLGALAVIEIMSQTERDLHWLGVEA